MVTAVAAGMPDYRVDSVTVLGEGLDNVAYEVNGELIARFSRAPDPERLARDEARTSTSLSTPCGGCSRHRHFVRAVASRVTDGRAVSSQVLETAPDRGR
jgi:hypothetical protein